MYFRLKEPWAFRGWKKLPYAIRAEGGEKKHEKPLFFAKEPFLALLSCDGETDVDPASLGADACETLEQLAREGVLERSETPLPPLTPRQRYHVFPARYLRGIHWSVTGKCNFNCRHCLVSAPDARHPQLPLHDCLRIVDQIAACGVLRVDITGGEPLVRRDFEEIVQALSRYGIDIGVLFTNASLLTPDTLDMLERHRQRPVFQLSYDGLGHHDWLRGVPGAEKDADAAFRLLRERGCAVNAAMCVHRENRDSLRDTARYLSGLGVRSLRVNAPQVMGVWKTYAEEYALTEAEVWETYRAYISRYFEDGMPLDLELDGYFRCRKGRTDYSVSYDRAAAPDTDWRRRRYCGAVRYHVYIGPEGRLAPCMGFSDHPALRKRFPSVLEQPLWKLTLEGFAHDMAETRVADLLERNPECASCGHLPRCAGGCMAESMTDEGDFLVPDRRACYFHKHIGVEAVRKVADEAIRTYRSTEA